MKIISLLLVILILSTSAFTQRSKAIDVLIDNIEEKVPKLMQEHRVPGLAIAMIDNANIVYKKGFGYSNIKAKQIISHSTGFNVGSISKLFTATAIMKLAESGRLDLDSPVEIYLKRWTLTNSIYDKSKVTIRSLLNHTAGISVHGYPGFTDHKKLPSLEASLNGDNGPSKANEKVEIIIEPQTKFKYSGGGYSILQLVIEEITKMAFEKYMEKTIFKPLKMKNTSFIINENILKNSAIPYNENKEELPFEYFTAKAAAGLQTTLDDFIIFMEDMLSYHTLLPKGMIDEMLIPTQVSGEVYGLGFTILKFGSIELKGHAGSNTGWQSGFFIDFKTKSGLIMMTNGDKGNAMLKNILKYWASFKYQK